MTNLVGLHDQEANAFSPAGTWILDTIALSENPPPKNYNKNFSWLARVNWSYGSTGTIPLDAAKQQTFLQRFVDLVKGSPNCSRWIIGNEPNLSREWPDGQPIYPAQYAQFYLRCRDAVHGILGTEVLIAAPGPWNNELKYAGNPNGDWIQNFSDVISACGGKWDGAAIHTYTHGYQTSLVRAQTFMDAPFQNRHYDFQTYRDYLNAIPDGFGDLSFYITETNGGENWQATGLIPEMAADIDGYNKAVTTRKIKSLIFYRWPKYDNYYIQGKTPVEQEYLMTVAKSYSSPVATVTMPKPAPVPPSIPEKLVSGKPTALVQAVLLNVRDKPGMEGSNIVGSKKAGDKVSILDSKEVGDDWWYQIGPSQWLISSWTDTPKVTPLSDWERAKKFTSGWEGGFQNNSWDPGNWTGCDVGAGVLAGTNFGISACSYPNLDIKNLTREQADEIYYRDFWLKSGADKLAWPLNLIVFDTAINFGDTIAIYYLQKSGGDPLKYIGLRLHGYRISKAWPQAGNSWVDRTVDLITEATT